MDTVQDHNRAFRVTSIEDYEPLIRGEGVERILRKAERLRDLHVVNINSTLASAPDGA